MRIRVFLKIIILAAVFFISAAAFSHLINREVQVETQPMATPTLPVVYAVYQTNLINEMHGYTQEMELTSMRDSVIPLDSGHEVDLQIDSYGSDLSGCAFEVYNIDGTGQVQKETPAELKENDELNLD